MSKSPMEQEKTLNFGRRLAYGAGGAGNQLAQVFIMTFILFYATDVIGLNAGIVGTLILVSKVLDGVSDLIFGSLMDRTHTRLGKARPWLLGITLPLAVCLVLLFSIPNFSVTVQYIYFFVLYTLFNAVCYTISLISHSTLNALITHNQSERVFINVMSYIMGFLVLMIANSFTLQFVEMMGGGRGGWTRMILIYAIIIVILLVICVAFTRELPFEETGEEEEKKTDLGLIQSIKYVCLNKYFFILLFTLMAYTILSSFMTASMTYYTTYTLGNANLMSIFSFGIFIPCIIGLLLTPMANKLFGLYRTCQVGFIISAVFGIVLIFFSTSQAIIVIMVIYCLRNLLQSPFSGTQSALTAQITEYSLLKHNVHIEGSLFSCISIATKIGSGLATALCGWCLVWIGYDGAAEVQTAATLRGIGMIFYLVPAIMLVVCAILMSLFNVEKANKELREAQTR